MVSIWAFPSFFVFQLYIRSGFTLEVFSPFGATEDNTYWTTEVTIETQKFNLIVDTGSSDLWVYASGVSYAEDVKPVPHNEYTCVKGATANCSYEGIWHVTYAANASTGVGGNVTYDKTTISGSTVQAMGIEQAYRAGSLASWAPDGILGMSFGVNSQAAPKQPTFMERLMPTLPEPVFGVEFVSTPTSKLANIEFGFVNKTKAREGLVTVPVKKSIWMLDDVSFTIGDHPNGYPPVSDGNSKPITMSLMFDTGGGSSLGLDPRITRAYYMKVAGAKATDSSHTTFKFPCDAVLPDLFLNFATGGTVGLSGYSMTFNNPDADNMCTGPINSFKIGEGTAKEDAVGGVGALFFQSKYVVFNMSSEPSMSFAIWNGTAEYQNPALIP